MQEAHPTSVAYCSDLYRSRAWQYAYLAENETTNILKARYLTFASCWHELAMTDELLHADFGAL